MIIKKVGLTFPPKSLTKQRTHEMSMNSIQDTRDMINNIQQKIKNLKLFIVHAEAEIHEMNEMIFDMEEKQYENINLYIFKN